MSVKKNGGKLLLNTLGDLHYMPFEEYAHLFYAEGL